MTSYAHWGEPRSEAERDIVEEFNYQMSEERRRADEARYRKSEMLEGLRTTGRVLDGQKPYPGQREELRGIQQRIDRIERGEEKP